MRKKFVVDTSVFVYDPNSYLSFEGNDIIIPITVLDELDKLKKQPSEAGKNARVFIRTLDRLSTLGDITKGIELENNITLKIDSLSGDGVSIGDPLYGDNRILACALAVKKAAKKTQTVLITKDINLRIRGKVLGIDSQDYEKDKIQSNELYAGFQSVEDEDAGLYLKEKGHLDAQAFNLKMLPNECIEFTDDLKSTVSYGRKMGKNVSILKEKSPWGLTARNKEQAFAINLLMDKNIPLVTLIGKAGSGKTLVTIACALEAVLERKMYEKIIVYRPIQAMGNDIGFLPGTEQEKLAPWMQPIMDSFEFLFQTKVKGEWKKNFEIYQKKGIIEMNALTYIRGRSIPNALMIIDEFQNLSKEEAKTILTRAGNNTKIVMTGDIEQIDNSYLDAMNNGLTYVVEKFKDSELAGHVTFTKGERSPLATKAAEIL